MIAEVEVTEDLMMIITILVPLEEEEVVVVNADLAVASCTVVDDPVLGRGL